MFPGRTRQGWPGSSDKRHPDTWDSGCPRGLCSREPSEKSELRMRVRGLSGMWGHRSGCDPAPGQDPVQKWQGPCHRILGETRHLPMPRPALQGDLEVLLGGAWESRNERDIWRPWILDKPGPHRQHFQTESDFRHPRSLSIRSCCGGWGVPSAQENVQVVRLGHGIGDLGHPPPEGVPAVQYSGTRGSGLPGPCSSSRVLSGRVTGIALRGPKASE